MRGTKEFFEQVEYLEQLNGYNSVTETITKTIEAEYKRKQFGTQAKEQMASYVCKVLEDWQSLHGKDEFTPQDVMDVLMRNSAEILRVYQLTVFNPNQLED